MLASQSAGNPDHSSKLGFTGEQTDDNGLIYLRARYYSPELGTFLRRDPVEGGADRFMSRNGYSYAEANAVNYTDPSGQCIDPISFLACAALVVGGSLFIGGVTAASYDVFVNQGVGLGGRNEWNFGAVDWLETPGYTAISVGIGSVAGLGAGTLHAAISAAPSALTMAAKWLFVNPLAKWGLIGGEAEWIRQTVNNIVPYDPNTGQFRNNFSWTALHPSNYDWPKIAKSVLFSGASRWVLGAFGYVGQQLSFAGITQNTTAAAYYGGLISAVSGAFAKFNDNRLRGLTGLQVFGDMSVADITWSYLTGTVVGGLSSYVSPSGFWKSMEDAWSYSSRTGLVINSQGITQFMLDRIYTVGWYMGVGAIPAVGQTALDVIERVNPVCRTGNGLGAGAYTNLASMISNPMVFMAVASASGFVANDAVNQCSRR